MCLTQIFSVLTLSSVSIAETPFPTSLFKEPISQKQVKCPALHTPFIHPFVSFLWPRAAYHHSSSPLRGPSPLHCVLSECRALCK